MKVNASNCKTVKQKCDLKTIAENDEFQKI